MNASQDQKKQFKKLFDQLFDRSDHHIALLDLTGEIVAVNSAWRAYGTLNKMPSSYESVGKNYLRICETAIERGDIGATQVYIGLQEVLVSGRPKFTHVYPCHSSTCRAWYQMWIEAQSPEVPAVVVAHKLICEKPLLQMFGKDESPPMLPLPKLQMTYIPSV